MVGKLLVSGCKCLAASGFTQTQAVTGLVRWRAWTAWSLLVFPARSGKIPASRSPARPVSQRTSFRSQVTRDANVQGRGTDARAGGSGQCLVRVDAR